MLLEDQDRGLWNRRIIAEGLALMEKAVRHDAPGPVPAAGGHRRGARAGGAARGHRLGGDRPALRRLERLQPSPVVTLNRAVAVAKVRGPAAALAMIEPLAEPLSGYFHFFGVKGALLDAARPRRGGPRRLRSGDRAGQHRRRGRPHPAAPRSPHQGRYGRTMRSSVGAASLPPRTPCTRPAPPGPLG